MWLLVKRFRQWILVFSLQFTYFVCESLVVFVHGRGLQVPDVPTAERWGYRSAHWEGWQPLTKAWWLSVVGYEAQAFRDLHRLQGGCRI